MKIAARLTAVVSLALAVAACELKKSENPLSPTVAGPIPGVDITAPRLLEPGTGWQIAGDKQPLTLLIENSFSNSPRPLNYTFEVASDAAFTNRVFTRENVDGGDAGRTSLRLPDALSSGRTYYWRAKAQDGANESPFSAATSFNVFTPVSFDKPLPISPANNVQTDSTTPEFRFRNAPHAGTPEFVTYTIELASNATFTGALVAWQVAEQPGETKLVSPSAGPYNTQLFWRVRASDGGVAGPWSDAAVFRTPPAPVVIGPPPPPPSGNCAAAASPLAIVECTRAKFSAHMGHTELIAFLRATAINLNNAGVSGGPFGLLRKENGANCNGYSCDVLCSGTGTSQRQYDVLIDAEGDQKPIWPGAKTYPSIRMDACHAP